MVSKAVELQVASEMASAGLKRMMEGYEREKECSDLAEPKGFVCLSTTGFAGGAPKPELSGMQCMNVNTHMREHFHWCLLVSDCLAVHRNLLSRVGNEFNEGANCEKGTRCWGQPRTQDTA